MEGGDGGAASEGGEASYAIEDAPHTEANGEEKGSNGILSSSTLAALQKQVNAGAAVRAMAAPAKAPAGPLVGYGSDDESD